MEGAPVRGHRQADERLLDDPAAIERTDPSGMLRAIASAGAQVRESAALAGEANLAAVSDEGRPRAVVVAGVGTAARTGDVLATVAGPNCPVPVLAHRSAGVPGWVGAGDAVIAVSASGRSPEALAAAQAAARRGARLVAIGPPDTELAEVAERARAPFVPVPRRAPARASLWGLTVPVLLAARALGLIRLAEADLAETATRLDNDAERCRTGAEAFVNPAKALALDVANAIPVVWGSSELATVAARRFGDMLSANARYPAVAGSLVEAGRGRVGLLDGVYGSLTESERDIFADPADGGSGRGGDSGGGGGEPSRLRVVLLRDDGLAGPDPELAPDLTGYGNTYATVAVPERMPAGDPRRAAAIEELATRRGVRCSVLVAEGASPLERLASLVAVPDFASVYLAIAHGLDPMAVPAVSELKELSAPGAPPRVVP